MYMYVYDSGVQDGRFFKKKKVLDFVLEESYHG